MADIQQAIRRMAYQYTVEGADKVRATQDAITASTTKTEQATLSLEKSFDNLERRYVSTVRQQQEYQKAQERINAAVVQNPALQARADAVLAALNQRYNQGTVAQKAFAAATSGVQGQLLALSAGAGPVGVFLSSLGPWGLAAATGIGAVSAVFNRLVEGAERIGDKSIELRKFSDVTGLTVMQIKGLTQAGGRLGIGSEEIENSLEKFSVGLNEARKGTGSLFEQIRAINPQLADELASTTNAAQGWDILAKALRSATEASQRNALARAAFGRGGIETGLVAVESATKGGIDAMSKGVKLTQEWVTETAKLRAENTQLEKSITNTMDAAYALPVLRRQNEYLRVQKEITDEMFKTGKTPAPVGMGAALPELVTRGPGDSASFNEAIAAAGKAARAGEEAAKAFKLDPETTAGWQQLDDAMGAAAQQSSQTVSLLEQQKNATAKAANTERERVSLLGAAATEQEKINVQTLALQVALDQNKISQEDFNRAVAGLTKHHEDQLVALQGQLSVAQQLTGAGQINAQYEATIANAKQQNLNLSQEIAKAELQRAIAIANANTGAARQLQTLQQEGELIRASSDADRDRIKARQTYDNLIKQEVDSTLAAAVASQQLANAEAERSKAEIAAAENALAHIRTASDAWDAYRQKIISWSVANDEAGKVTRRLAAAAEDASYWVNKLSSSMFEAGQAALLANTAFVPFATTWASMGPTSLGTGGGTQGKYGLTQFNPAGYTLERVSTAGNIAQRYPQVYDQMFGAGNWKVEGGKVIPDLKKMAEYTAGLQQQQATDTQTQLATNAQTTVNQGLASQGAVATIQGILAGSLGDVMGKVAQQYLTALPGLVPEDQRAGILQQELDVIRQQPVTLEREQLIQQLVDSLKSLQGSVDANTQAITDVFSPFYSSDPRTSKLGYRTFAGGGIMTALGELPLHRYQSGGMATSPQVAVFGEGSTPEAYVPVPSGRIPVEIKTPANSNRMRPVNVTINVMGNADSATAAALKQTGYQAAQVMRRGMAAAR